MIAAAQGIHYVHEPFNVSDPPSRGVCAIRFAHWFTYVCSENEAAYVEPLRRTIALEYNLGAALRHARSRQDLYRTLEEYRMLRRQRRAQAVTLVKDPIAVFSAPWLAARFDMRVVVLMRHPAAFASSIKRLGWSHPFSDFLDQPLLLRDVLSPFEKEIGRFAAAERGKIDQAILLWRLIYHAVREFAAEHRDWILVRHEDLSRGPVQGFRELFSRLGLPFSSQIEDRIRQTSGSHNPVDPGALPGSREMLRLNSQAAITTWKQRLTRDEIMRVREGTADIAPDFYTDAEWE